MTVHRTGRRPKYPSGRQVMPSKVPTEIRTKFEEIADDWGVTLTDLSAYLFIQGWNAEHPEDPVPMPQYLQDAIAHAGPGLRRQELLIA